MEIFPYSADLNDLPEKVLVKDSSLNPGDVVFLHKSVLKWLHSRNIVSPYELQSQKLCLSKSDSSLEYDEWSTICETSCTEINNPSKQLRFDGNVGLVTHELIDGKMSFVCRLGE